MKKKIVRKARVHFHDGFPLHIQQKGVIIPLGPMLHVFGEEECFSYTLSNFAPMAFLPRPDPISCRVGNPVHYEGVSVCRSPHNINTSVPRSGREFLELRVVEVWPAPKGRFRPALVSQAGVIVTAVVGAAWVVARALAIGAKAEGVWVLGTIGMAKSCARVTPLL